MLPVESDQPKISFEDQRNQDPQATIGARGHPGILRANGGAYGNERLEQLLAIVVGRLVTSSNDPDRAYDITVLDSPAINAFALPGGYLYVTRGLLALANDTAEIAAVLAHEMAHVSSNHGIRRRQQALAADMAERVVSDVVTNRAAGEVVKASSEQRLVVFSQRQELQADAVGIKHIGEVGYDSFAASRFLKSMHRYSKWSSVVSGAGNDMWSSHPSTPQRIELAKGHARRAGPPGTGDRNRGRYLQGIDGLPFGGADKDGLVRDHSFIHPRLGIAFDVPSGFDISNRDDAVLVSGPDQMALRFDAVAEGKNKENSADYLRSGWVNGLKTDSVVNRNINGLAAAEGVASAGDWKFIITVVQYKKRYYRFILAAPRSTDNIETIGRQIAGSFRKMNKSDHLFAKPLQIKVLKVKASDTVGSLAARLQGVVRKIDLFRALNGLDNRDGVKVGDQVKIVAYNSALR